MNEACGLAGKRLLVTGAAGFIGSHLCRKLKSLGGEIHALDIVSPPGGADGLQWWRSDLSEPSDVLRLVQAIRPDTVFHLGSYVTGTRDPGAVIPTFRANLMSTVHLLAAAQQSGCLRVILAGSMEEPRSGQNGLASISPYAVSKWASSAYGRMFSALYGLPVVILHLFMVYGPGQGDIKKLIPYVILSLLRDETPKISSGAREVDWIFVEDVVDGIVRCAQADGAVGQTIEIGTGTLVPIREIVTRIVAIVRPGVKPEFGALPDRSFESSRAADTEKTFALIGWRSQTGLDDGLQRTVDWYRKRGF
jgi:UDP-glucose 4-epimerase